MPNFNVSVIVSTYNQPHWLEKVLRGLACQSIKKFEIVIADDGSGPETKGVIERCRKILSLDIKHVWHDDDGFRKTKILNEAVKVSGGDYLIFLDGDCIPRRDFVETHLRNSAKGFFLSGGAFRLPMSVSKVISGDDIQSGRIFKIKWLLKAGVPLSVKASKLVESSWFTRFMNKVTPAGATWNGGNSSTWREYIFALNGFNEDMHYGAEDREFGSRLGNYGIRGKQIRYSAICLHLDHGRSYINNSHLKENKAIWRKSIKDKVLKTERGIIKV
ncbi:MULTISPECIES: glycosyltransferase family 2 protein [unclassified Carboxylicivirga]|uniref:glycosyltransferase family 2 protein n=1 Tax=Carboxylicivirga TaxID=1628153 RepID=UPI003D341B1A